MLDHIMIDQVKGELSIPSATNVYSVKVAGVLYAFPEVKV